MILSAKNSWFNEAVAMYGGNREEVMAVLSHCLECGEVHCDGQGFIAAYKTHSPKSVDKPDTWFIYIAVGNIKRVWDSVEKLDFVAYERNDERVRFIPMKRFARIMR